MYNVLYFGYVFNNIFTRNINISPQPDSFVHFLFEKTNNIKCNDKEWNIATNEYVHLYSFVATVAVPGYDLTCRGGGHKKSYIHKNGQLHYNVQM